MVSLEYLRQFRIGQFTIFDTVAAYVGIVILSPILNWLMSKLHLRVSIVSWLWFTMPLSAIFHLIFRQPTPLMKILSNPERPEFYWAIIVIIGMVLMGLKGVSRF